MKAIIKSDSIRIDGSTLRFLVQYPDIALGYHGISTPLPTNINKVKAAILAAGTTLTENKSQVDAWKLNFMDYLDTQIEV